jgi:phage shock protein C
MKCYYHPERDAVGVCSRCGRAVCAEDSIIIDDKLYCKECADKIKGSDFTHKRLYRSRKDKILCGVCGGIAEYVRIDPTIVRILWVIFSFAYGTGIIAYIIMCLIMPVEPA